MQTLTRLILTSSILVVLSVQGVAAKSSKTKQTPDSYLNAANMFMQSQNYKSAIDCYSKAIKSDKNNAQLYQSRANAYLFWQKPKKAVGDLNKSISLNPNEPNSYALRARAFDGLSDYKKELSDVDKLVTFDSSNGTNLLWRARLNLRFKEMKDVIADCDKAINTGGLGRDDLKEIYKMRSEAYKKLGKKKESQVELAKYNSLAN